MASTDVSTAESPQLGRTAVRAILVGLLTGVFMSALDGMIMATAMRTVADSLHGLTAQAWVSTGYLMTMTITAPLYGKLSDILGRKPLYLAAVAVFVIGSVMCAMAQSIYELAVYRGVQGLGAGGLASLALAAIADMFPPAERTRHQANVGIIYGVASVAGPVVGGLFAGADSVLGIAGWRWIFLINVPVGVFALVVITKLYTVRSVRTSHRIDYWGGIGLVLCLVPLLLVAEQGREWGWTSPAALACYTAGLLGLGFFLAVEHAMGEHALIPFSLFRIGPFAQVNVINFLGGVGAFTALAFIPLHLQIVTGLSPTAAGLLLLPQSVATTVGAKLCGPVLARGIHYRFLLGPGLGIMSLSYLALALAGVDTPVWVIAVVVTVMGFGLGLFMQTVITALQNSVPPASIGVASGMYGFSRQLGGILGTAVFLSLLFNLATDRIIGHYRSESTTPEFAAAARDPAVLANPADQEVLAGLRAGNAGVDLNDTSTLDSLDERIARPILEGMSSAMSTVFLIIALLVAAAAALALPVRAPAGGRPTSMNGSTTARGNRTR